MLSLLPHWTIVLIKFLSTQYNLAKPQLVQNAAARSNRRVDIMPSVASLHWLPVRF